VLALIGDKSLYKNYSNCKRKLGKTNLPPKLKSSPQYGEICSKTFFSQNFVEMFLYKNNRKFDIVFDIVHAL
jgi:hypothetical protein